MRTTELFKFNRSPKRLNESLEKAFGRKINFSTFDTPKLEDARNKLRTQISQIRGQSGFNENLENDTLTQAQWMHDAIVAELMDRQEHIVDATEEIEEETLDEEEYDYYRDYKAGLISKAEYDELVRQFQGRSGGYSSGRRFSRPSYNRPKGMYFYNVKPGQEDDARNAGLKQSKSGKWYSTFQSQAADKAFGPGKYWEPKESVEQGVDEVSPPGFKGTVKAMKKHGDEIDNPFALAWHMKNKGYKSHKKADGSDKKESVDTGDDMTNLREGEIQQASAIVTAKTMVDRVGRWIEELSGMENDTLLQLGDSIRDEMGQEQAKNFISAVAPAIQQALENLKTTRETLASGVRTLTGEEQAAGMLGAEPSPDMAEPAEPDAMNAGSDEEMGGGDEFAAAEPAAGGMETAGREQRESIERQNRLLKVLAG